MIDNERPRRDESSRYFSAENSVLKANLFCYIQFDNILYGFTFPAAKLTITFRICAILTKNISQI